MTTFRRLFVIAIAWLGVSAQAATKPELKFPELCWKESGLAYIVDGTFSVFIKTTDLSKEELLTTLRDLNRSNYLMPTWYPSVTENLDTLVIDLKAANQQPGESRAEFRKKVNAVALQVSHLAGVQINCETQAFPNPSTTGSN